MGFERNKAPQTTFPVLLQVYCGGRRQFRAQLVSRTRKVMKLFLHRQGPGEHTGLTCKALSDSLSGEFLWEQQWPID